MGCINSKFSDDELVSRCKSRKNFMKQAVLHRHSFAAAHSAYLLALRNTGSALRQFAEGEGGAPAAGQAPLAALPEPPPPPPLPMPSPSWVPVLKRASAVSSSLTEKNGRPAPAASEQDAAGNSPPTSPAARAAWDFFNPFRPADPPLHLQEQRKSRQVQQNDLNGEEDNPESKDVEASQIVENIGNEGKQPASSDTEAQEETAIVKWGAQDTDDGGLESEVGMLQMRLGVRKDLVEIVKELDEEFLKASAGGTDVSRALETQTARLHNNVAKSKSLRWATDRNHHPARVFSSLSWNWSRSSRDEVENNVDEAGRNGSHALTLERLLAWEKKLYEEVKLVESLRKERENKCSLLRRQEAKAEDANTIDKTRAQIKRLHSLILVSYQGLDSTIEAIEDLRDDELHPQLVALIEGLNTMWSTMHRSHAQQTQIIIHIKSLDASMNQQHTTDVHHQATLQLERELSAWHESFCKLVASQRGYMTALHGWLRLSLIKINTGKDKVEDEVDEYTKEARGEPEAHRLCKEWQRALGCLPDKVASEAIKSLGEVVKAMAGKQAEEMKQKKKVEKLERQWEKRANGLEQIEESAGGRKGEREDEEEDEEVGAARRALVRGVVAEKRAAAEALRERFEGEKMKHLKSVQDTRVLTMNNLQTGLPGVLEAMTGFSTVCSQAFQHLYTLTRISAAMP